MITSNPVARLIIALTLCLSAGYADLTFFVPAIPSWYGPLVKPSFIPPVSIIYYGIIAISLLLAFCLYSIWNSAQKNKEARLAVWLFIICLFLNVAWFFVFFRAESVFFSMVVMAVLLTVVVCTMYQSLRSAVLSVLFQIPYLVILLAVTYAIIMIYMTNPDLPLLRIVF
ncbi:TspO/MBR family protein [Methanoregula sp.]|uniref:TspO/MBR family protein n=1 Tax=Methanoregula sp. TaxID=2052170 RepID=UPI003C7324F5